jgi:hypothetical protein
MKSTPKVDLFVIGAPKCGTTSLAAALQRASAFHVPHIKEPHFFCDDMPGMQRINRLADYDALYEDAGDARRVDCSVWYLSSSVAAQRIQSYNPSAQIIVMLRDPISMLPSLHNQLIFSGREDISDFDVAWRMSGARRRGEDIPPNAAEKRHLEYDHIADFENQIKPWLELFKTNLHIIFFEDIIADEASELARLGTFLGLPADGLSQGLPNENKSRAHRFPALSNLLMYPPFPFSTVKSTVKRLIGPMAQGRMRGFYSALSHPAPKISICPNVIAEIRACYGSYDDLKSRIRATKAGYSAKGSPAP